MQAPAKTYEVLETLARGGMGEVLVARERTGELFERLVVLKTVLPHLAGDAELARALLDEARVASQLQHPNVAQIHDVAFLDGSLCIVMEWLRGHNFGAILSKLARDGRAIPPEVSVALLLGAAAGLGYAHRATDARGRALGIVHRDVSPQNIFLTRDGTVKVIDFGIALSSQRSIHTTMGVVKGKLGYMSPEQLRGSGVDLRADLWALGVVAWEMLTGRRLFARGADLVETILSGRIEAPSRVGALTDPELDAIVLRLLERDRERRTARCEVLEEELLRWGRGRALATPHQLAAWIAEIFEPEQDVDARAQAEPTCSVQLMSVAREEHTETLDLPPATQPEIALPEERSPEAPARSPRRTQAAAVIAAGAVAALVAAVAAGLWVARVDGAEPAPTLASDAEPVSLAEARPAPIAPSAATAPSTVRFVVEGLPEGASVWLDGSPIPGGAVELARGPSMHRLEVRAAEGAVLLARELAADANVTIPLVSLPPREPPPVTDRAPGPRRRPPRSERRTPVGGIDTNYD